MAEADSALRAFMDGGDFILCVQYPRESVPSRKSVLSGVHAQGQAAHVSGDSMVISNQLCCMHFLQTQSSPILKDFSFCKGHA